MATEDYDFGPPDEVINSQSEGGKKTYDKQRYGRPQFSFPNISQDQVDKNRLLDVLLGAGAGARAAEGAAHPGAAMIMGLSGGVQSARASQAQRDAADRQAAKDRLDFAPVGAVAPSMAKALMDKYGMDVSEIPMGEFQKFAGLLKHTDDLEKQLILIKARADAKLDAPKLDKSMQAAVTKAKTAAASARAAVGSVSPELDRILELNKNTRAGIAGEVKQKLSSGMNVGQNIPEYKNTVDVVNSLQSMVTKVLKSTFGGQLSDSERAYLQEVYAASSKYTQKEREIAIATIRRMVTDKSMEADATLSELTGARQGGGGGLVEMIAPNGEAFTVPSASVATAISRGARRR